MHRRWSLLVGSATAAIVAASFATPTASAAASPQRAVVHTASYIPLRGAVGHIGKDTVFGNVDYNGGPVMPSNTDYIVFWSPKGLGAYGPEYVSGLERWFKDLAHDSGGDQNTDSVVRPVQRLDGRVRALRRDVRRRGARHRPVPREPVPGQCAGDQLLH